MQKIWKGLKYGRLTVVIEPCKGSNTVECICECGTYKVADKENLKRGHTRSCGCLFRDVMRSTKTKPRRAAAYRKWVNMLKRCDNTKNTTYAGRGISVCAEWVNDYETFLLDMGDVPFKGAQLDRIDNNKGYSKDNCRWCTSKENNRNKQRTVHLYIFGESKPLIQWAEELGVPLGTMRYWNRCISQKEIEEKIKGAQNEL